MDEKGCQRGGGRRLRLIRFFVPKGRRPRHKLRSDKLELVTVLECVAADGGNIKPGFVFSGKEICPEWGMVDKDIGQVNTIHKFESN